MNDRERVIYELDKEVREKALKRDGYRCVLCGQTKREWLQCGHLFSRVSYTTRWDPMNVYCQCRDCNQRHESNPHVFTLWFVRQFGVGPYEKLLIKSKGASRLPTPQLEDLLASIRGTDWGRPKYEPTPEIEVLAKSKHMRRSQWAPWKKT
jgi:hypothetical protein